MLDVFWIVLAQRHSVYIQTAVLEDIANPDTSPLGRTHGPHDPVRRDENFAGIVVQILATIASALQRGDYFVFGKLFQVRELELVCFLMPFPLTIKVYSFSSRSGTAK